MFFLCTYCLTKKNASRPITRGATSNTTRSIFVANKVALLRGPSPANMSGDNEERVKGGRRTSSTLTQRASYTVAECSREPSAYSWGSTENVRPSIGTLPAKSHRPLIISLPEDQSPMTHSPAPTREQEWLLWEGTSVLCRHRMAFRVCLLLHCGATSN